MRRARGEAGIIRNCGLRKGIGQREMISNFEFRIANLKARSQEPPVK